MNSTDDFVQFVDHPSQERSSCPRPTCTCSAHVPAPTSGIRAAAHYDNKVFGYTGRPAGGHTSLATVGEISSSWQAAKSLTVNLLYGHAAGKSAISSIYPADPNAQYGYAELVYRWGEPLHVSR